MVVKGDFPRSFHTLSSKAIAPSTPDENQSVENAGVAFVKGANERNYFSDKINKQ